MPTDRLTRQELSWLLAQEARSAATMLRKGVSNLKIEAAPSGGDVSTTLDALDDAVKTLVTLQSGNAAHARRGRIDVAALILELAPNATLNLEPGTGTEILAEESELRRMLQVLLTLGTPPGEGSASIAVRSHDGQIRVEVSLGPDSSGAAGIEQAWLHRMAVRHGGRLSLEGNTITLQLPAGAEQREVEELRRELAAAQEQGEMYAREIASMFADKPADEAPSSSTHEPSLAALCGSLAATLRPELQALREGTGDRDARLGALLSLVDSLARFAQVEPRRTTVDVVRVLHDAVAGAGARADRRSVQLVVDARPLSVSADARDLGLLLSLLIEQAVDASADGATVRLTLADGALLVDDAGPSVPSGVRSSLLLLAADPATLGRPRGPGLGLAASLATRTGSSLRLDDAPGGGLRVRVAFGSQTG